MTLEQLNRDIKRLDERIDVAFDHIKKNADRITGLIEKSRIREHIGSTYEGDEAQLWINGVPLKVYEVRMEHKVGKLFEIHAIIFTPVFMAWHYSTGKYFKIEITSRGVVAYENTSCELIKVIPNGDKCTLIFTTTEE